MGPCPSRTSKDDMTQPSGNMNGATVTLTTELTGLVTLSNCTLVVAFTGVPGQFSNGSSLTNVKVVGATNNFVISDGAAVTVTSCNVPGFNGYAGAAINITKSVVQSPEFTGIFLDPPGNNTVINDNLIICDGVICHEPIHLVNGTVTGLNISYNETQGASRYGIEVQCQAVNAICQGNYLHKPNLNPGDQNQSVAAPVQTGCNISWACGPSSTPVSASTVYSSGCQILTNVIDNTDGAYPTPMTAGKGQQTAIEAMGDNLLIEGNWIKNFGMVAATWIESGKPATSKSNIFIGAQQQGWQGESGGDTSTVNSTGDQWLAITATNIPAMPAHGPRYATGAVMTLPVTTPTLTHKLTQSVDGVVLYETDVYSDGSLKQIS
jgi:hypothetical protein